MKYHRRMAGKLRSIRKGFDEQINIVVAGH
jgi:hypothetical protein